MINFFKGMKRMEIISLKVLRGPNYWSNYRQHLIEMKLDLGIYEELPTNLLPSFLEKLKILIPTLYYHQCSLHIEGGFFQRIEEGTWLGHVIEHIALELQNLAGMDCGFGRTYSTITKGIYHVIFSYQIEEAGVLAAKAAVELVHTLAQDLAYTKLSATINELRTIYNEHKLGISTQAIIDEAKKRNIPIHYVKDSSLIVLGQGNRQKKIWGTITSNTSSIGVDIVANKELTKNLLEKCVIPVPKGLTVHSIEELENAIVALGFPLVIKPVNGNHGRGISTNINHKEKAIAAFHIAQKISYPVHVEKFLLGYDYRFLVINYRLIAVAKRTPALIKGDGVHSVHTLINKINDDPRRGDAHDNFLTNIKIDAITQMILDEKKLTLESILPKDEILYLKDTANLSTGGVAEDVTDFVHPSNIQLAERIARLVGLDICGIDMVSKNIRLPLTADNGGVIEVNASPGFRMHLSPNKGHARNVAKPVIDMLFPPSTSGRIPVVAVTGTNGKTTVVRLIAHLAKEHAHYVGFTTTDGIYLNGNLLYEGDCSGPLSAQVILNDPLVDFAVLECARGGILRAGLGVDETDISVIMNVTSDHLGLCDIHTLEELARVKAVVAYSTKKSGYAILNSEDELVYQLKEDLTCHVALFGLKENARIISHCQQGGLAAFVKNSLIVLRHGDREYQLAHVDQFPVTFNGSFNCMIQNLLAAFLAGFVSRFGVESMQNVLMKFYPTINNTPGRMNVYHFDNFQVMLDYAHNEGAFIELKQFVDTMRFSKKIGIVAATGDRRDEDIIKLGKLFADIFDEIIIRHNRDGRGRTDQEITDLLLKGIQMAPRQPYIKVISHEFEAVNDAFSHVIPNTFIYYSVDDVFDAIQFLNEKKENFKQQNSFTEKTYDS